MIPPPPEAVLDTNILFAALRSRDGASFRILSAVRHGRMRPIVSYPLALEYEATLMRDPPDGLTRADIGHFLAAIFACSRPVDIYYRWRPTLTDPGDDMVLEAAIAGGCRWIVTHNLRDFLPVKKHGITPLLPRHFLPLLGDLP